MHLSVLCRLPRPKPARPRAWAPSCPNEFRTASPGCISRARASRRRAGPPGPGGERSREGRSGAWSNLRNNPAGERKSGPPRGPAGLLLGEGATGLLAATSAGPAIFPARRGRRQTRKGWRHGQRASRHQRPDRGRSRSEGRRGPADPPGPEPLPPDPGRDARRARPAGDQFRHLDRRRRGLPAAQRRRPRHAAHALADAGLGRAGDRAGLRVHQVQLLHRPLLLRRHESS